MGLEQITATLGLSELQFALGLIGIFLVVLVAIVNLRSARAKRQARIRQLSLDLLMQRGRTSPRRSRGAWIF